MVWGFPQAVVSRNGQPGQIGSLAGRRTQAFLSASVLVRHMLVSVVCVDLNHSVSCSCRSCVWTLTTASHAR